MSPRAPKETKDKRDRPFTVRYTDQEEAAVASAAREKSLEVASWIRMVSVEAAREQAKKKGAKT